MPGTVALSREDRLLSPAMSDPATSAAEIAAPSAPPFQHSNEYRFRRFLNWFPLGLAYAFLYMGRYNLNVAARELGRFLTKADFGTIFGFGAGVYGIVFVL